MSITFAHCRRFRIYFRTRFDFFRFSQLLHWVPCSLSLSSLSPWPTAFGFPKRNENTHSNVQPPLEWRFRFYVNHIYTAPRTLNRQQKTDNITFWDCWLLINHQIGEMGSWERLDVSVVGSFSQKIRLTCESCFKSYPLTGWLYNLTDTKYL